MLRVLLARSYAYIKRMVIYALQGNHVPRKYLTEPEIILNFDWKTFSIEIKFDWKILSDYLLSFYLPIAVI